MRKCATALLLQEGREEHADYTRRPDVAALIHEAVKRIDNSARSATPRGVTISNPRRIAKETSREHLLAQQLWSSGIHEA